MELEEESIRLLKEERQAEGLLPEEKETGIYSWAEKGLVPLSDSPNPVGISPLARRRMRKSTPLFWHIPKVRWVNP